jgi:hypothetical protein
MILYYPILHNVLQRQQQSKIQMSVTDHCIRVTAAYRNNKTPTTKGLGNKMAKRIVNIRLRPDQEERINAIVERSAILDTSKFVRIAVDWLLRADIGEVIKTIVADEAAFPDYAMPKKTAGRKKGSQKKRGR